MKIVYNPAEGADISNVNVGGSILDPHPKNSLKQYNDKEANHLLETFGFLRLVDEDEAKSILEQQKKAEEAPEEFACEYCAEKGETRTFSKQIGLTGHLKTHKAEIEAKGTPVVDPNLIPVAGSKKANARVIETKKGVDQVNPELLPNGKDADGVEWVGEGLQEQHDQSFGPKKPVGTDGQFEG